MTDSINVLEQCPESPVTEEPCPKTDPIQNIVAEGWSKKKKINIVLGVIALC